MSADSAPPEVLATTAPPRSPWSGAKRTKIAAATIILLTFVLGFWPSFDEAAAPMDEGTLLVYPELMQHGYVPYRDFETFYGPAGPGVLAAAYSVFGVNIFVERAVGLFYRIALLLAIFGLLQRRGTILASGCTLIAGCLLLTTQLAAFAWIGGLACGLGALWAVADFSRPWRNFAGGFLAGAALLYRPDLGLAMLLSMLPFLFAMPGKARWRCGAGAALALAPFAILAILAGPAQLLDNLFFYPVLYSNPGRRLPFVSARPFVRYLFLAHFAAALANVIAAILATRRDRTGSGPRVFLAIALFVVAVTPQALQRFDFIHLMFVAFLSFGLLPVSLLILFRRDRADSANFSAPLALAAVVFVIAGIAPKIWLNVGTTFATAVSSSMSHNIFVEQNGRSFPVPSLQVANVLGKLFEKLERLSKPGDRLFVGPGDLRRTNYCDTFIYHLFPGLKPATYFLEMNPFSANRPGSRLAKDVESADWLVLDTSLDKWHERNGSSVNGPEEPNIVVRTQFTLIGQYGPFVLLQHKG